MIATGRRHHAANGCDKEIAKSIAVEIRDLQSQPKNRAISADELDIMS
jgi:hypothetical protein